MKYGTLCGRFAQLRGLWNHLHRADAWTVWQEAAADPDWVVASRLVDLPSGVLSAEVAPKMALLFAGLLGRPELDARLSLLRRAPHLPIADSRLPQHWSAPYALRKIPSFAA